MPVYNGVQFVAAAIDSVLAQTFTNFTFHIVDDGSTDGTSEVLRRYAAADDRIVLQTMAKNVGFAAALNAGCRASTGEYIARMDGDDICLPERFARQISFLEQHPDVGVLGTSVQSIDEQDRIGRVWPCPTQPGLTAWALLFTCIIVHPSVMLRRRVLVDAGYYPSGYTPVEDYALWMRLVAKTRVTCLPDVLVRYREVAASLSRAQRERLESESIRIFQETVGWLPSGDVSDVDVKMLRALSQHRYPAAIGDIERLAGLIVELAGQRKALAPLLPEDVSAIERDAAVRLWLLAALSVRLGKVMVAARLARAAVRLSPRAIIEFSKKALGAMRRESSPQMS